MALADAVAFNAASGGTGSFVFASAIDSFRTPAQATTDGAITNGGVYSYFAQDSLTAPTQREWGRATYTAATHTFARTSVLGGVSSGTDTGTSPVNFSSPPVVAITLLGEDVRIVLAADADYYVATTGNDANPGTAALPWLTIQHAINFVTGNVDGRGFTATINIGAGTFAGFGAKPSVGIPHIFVNGAGATTIIQTGPNDGIYNAGECMGWRAQTDTNWYIANFTADGSINPTGVGLIVIFGFNNVYAGTPSGAASTLGFKGPTALDASQNNIITTTNPGATYDDGFVTSPTVTIFGPGDYGNYGNAFGTSFIGLNAAVTFSGSPQFTIAIYRAVNGSGGYCDSTFSGAIGASSPNYLVDGGRINFFGTLAAMPGTAGTLINGGIILP